MTYMCTKCNSEVHPIFPSYSIDKETRGILGWHTLSAISLLMNSREGVSCHTDMESSLKLPCLLCPIQYI